MIISSQKFLLYLGLVSRYLLILTEIGDISFRNIRYRPIFIFYTGMTKDNFSSKVVVFMVCTLWYQYFVR
jgi:hypothetical protein